MNIRDDLQDVVKELSTEDAAPAPEAAPSPAPAEQKEEKAPAEGRDASGKFAPKTPAKEEKPEQEEQTAAAPVAQATPTPSPAPAPSRGPISWTPEERQAWGSVPAPAQQAILRREREIDTALRQTAEARRFAGEIQQVMQPYMHIIEAEGSTPARAIQSVMQTAAILRTAPPGQKAAAVADMIMQFGIDVQQLDTALQSRLQGMPAPNDPSTQIMSQIEQKFKPVMDFVSSLQQRQQQLSQNTMIQAEQTLQEFMNDPANEFAMDVAEDMADILEVAANRGRTMSLQEAYARATMLHPEISKIVEGRKRTQEAAQQTAAAQRARSAAASVTSSGAPSGDGETGEDADDIRSAIGAALKSHSARI